MAGRGTGKGKSAWETEAHLRSVQRLASYLQRAVETGRGIRTIMVQVDRYMCKRFSEESSDVIRLVRDLERRSSSANIRHV